MSWRRVYFWSFLNKCKILCLFILVLWIIFQIFIKLFPQQIIIVKPTYTTFITTFHLPIKFSKTFKDHEHVSGSVSHLQVEEEVEEATVSEEDTTTTILPDISLETFTNVPLGYLVNTGGCKILDFNATQVYDPNFDPALTTPDLEQQTPCPQAKLVKVRKLFQTITNEEGRSHGEKRTFLLGQRNGPKCCYRSIKRTQENPNHYTMEADNGIEISQYCVHIPRAVIGVNQGVSLMSEFVQIECQPPSPSTPDNEKDGVPPPPLLYDFYATVFPPSVHSKETQKKVRYWDRKGRRPQKIKIISKTKNNNNNNEPPPSNLPPSILIIGVDSTSRLHLQRSAPLTREFLEENDFVEMKGHTKIGDKTLPQIMGLLGGMRNRNYSCWPTPDLKMDGCAFIWTNFSEHGYATGFFEENAHEAIFNNQRPGFVLQPTDYYLRPVTVAYKQRVGKEVTGCVGHRSQTQFMMDYLTDFLDVMENPLDNHHRVPYFLLTWFGGLTHDDVYGLKSADSKFEKILTKAVDLGGDQTIILFISDHGYGYKFHRTTFQGYFEESLPFFFIRLPPWLKQARPKWFKNLKENSQKLTSPLDVHATLEDILTLSCPQSEEGFFDAQNLCPNLTFTHSNWESTIYSQENGTTSSSRSVYSFFEKIPSHRTCQMAHIPAEFCRCQVAPGPLTDDTLKMRLVHTFMRELNQLIKSESMGEACEELKLDKLLYARKVSEEVSNNLMRGDEVSSNFKDYVVAVQTRPVEIAPLFEATFRHFDDQNVTILGDIRRISAYGGQKECTNNGRLRPFCVCVEKREE